MYPVTEIFIFIYRFDYIRMKISGKRRGKFYSFDAGCRNCPKQTGKECRAGEFFETRFGFRTITVDVLADQVDFLNVLPPKLQNVWNYFRSGKAFFPTSGKRHDTITAEFTAAFNDRHKSDVGRMPLRAFDRPIIVGFSSI